VNDTEVSLRAGFGGDLPVGSFREAEGKVQSEFSNVESPFLPSPPERTAATRLPAPVRAADRLSSG
jgi:hypothetical protein